eukprot:423899-Rhodomonas_salina.1
MGRMGQAGRSRGVDYVTRHFFVFMGSGSRTAKPATLELQSNHQRGKSVRMGGASSIVSNALLVHMEN